VYLRAGAQDLTARTDARRLPRPGERLHVTIDPTRVHYFDRSTGRAIGGPP
jgi:hypothetical protein